MDNEVAPEATQMIVHQLLQRANWKLKSIYRDCANSTSPFMCYRLVAKKPATPILHQKQQTEKVCY